MLGIADAFGSSWLPANGLLSSKPVSASGALDGPRRPLVVKAVGTDSRGRRVAGGLRVPGLENGPTAQGRTP